MAVDTLITLPKAVTVEFKFYGKNKRIKNLSYYGKEGLSKIYDSIKNLSEKDKKALEDLVNKSVEIELEFEFVNRVPFTRAIKKTNNSIDAILKVIKDECNKETVSRLKNYVRATSHEFAELIHYKLSRSLDDRNKSIVDGLGLTSLEELKMLTKSKLFDLGFRLWSDEDKIYLIPLNLLSALDPKMNVYSINNDIKALKDINKDTRFGCLAYGFYLNK